jgi:hypothetical protein
MISRYSAYLTPAMAGVFICIVLSTLSGCATQQASRLLQEWPVDIPIKTKISDIPFFPQEDYECGPASLAMLFNSSGVHVLPEQLQEQVYIPGRKGSLQIEMLVSSRRNGLVAYLLAPNLETVLREVSAGNPVLIFQNVSLPIYPIWHYAVVIGFDRDRNVLILHSGRTSSLEMSLYTFERSWNRGGNWAMLALPPTRLPVTASPDLFAGSVAAIERHDSKIAQTAYETALKQWPNNRLIMFGAGNTAYKLKQLHDAANIYRNLVAMHPDFADGWNNLAQTLLDLGQRQGASNAIAKAVALGGMRIGQYLELERQINSK